VERVAAALQGRYHLVAANGVDDAIAALRAPADLAVVIAAHDPLTLDGARVLSEARVLRPECRRVLVASGARHAHGAARTGERDVVLDAVNRCRPHHVESGWPEGEPLLALLDRLAAWSRCKAELEGAHSPHRDGLTGLYTHRAFQERLREEMARARRYGKPLSLLYVDVDELALVNRELGRDAGDAALRRMAEVLASPDLATRLRESDIAARFGGEEFAILLPETSKEGAAVKAERVRAAVEQAVFPGARAIRVSVGIAGFPDDAGTPTDLVARAEQALAAAKAAGRNCVRMSPGGEERAAAPGARRAAPGRPADLAVLRAERFTTYHVRLFDIVGCLRRDRSLACLFVDLSQLRDVERELGPSPHADLVARAGDVLEQMRGDRLRKDDLVCRTEDSDGYLCFLAAPRDGTSASPADLEAISARVEATLERELSAALAGLSREQPRVVVGFSRVLDNPMVRPERLLVRLVGDARRSALLHRERATQRNRALLQEIILRGALHSVYQPIVDLATGGVFGFEGLARGPRDSTLETPTALFSVADQVDLTFELDRACLRSALAGAAALEPAHRLFVNLLPTSFYDSSTIESEVATLLSAAEITPANLVFEITERLAIENFASFRQALAGYTDAGFGVAIDDVGTRHSNLETVMALRPHFIKLSDVLTRGVSRSTVKREMVRSLQRIAEAIDAVIVAEGIEGAEDLAVLCGLGVRYGQGYFLARPGPPFPQLRTSVRRAVRGAARLRWAGSPPVAAAAGTPPPEIDEIEARMDADDTADVAAAGPCAADADAADPDADTAEPTSPGRSHLPSLDADLAIGTLTSAREDDDASGSTPWPSLGDELGASAGTPLLGALRRRSADPAGGFLDEDTTSGDA